MGKRNVSDEFAANFSGLADRYREICRQKFRNNHAAFAEKCGIHRTALSHIRNDNQCPPIPGIDTFRVLIALPEIDARWLLFGEGEMEQPTVEQPQQPQQESREYLSLLQAYRAAIEENVRLQMTLDTLRRTRPYSVTDGTPLPAAAEDPAQYPRKKQA